MLGEGPDRNGGRNSAEGHRLSITKNKGKEKSSSMASAWQRNSFEPLEPLDGNHECTKRHPSDDRGLALKNGFLFLSQRTLFHKDETIVSLNSLSLSHSSSSHHSAFFLSAFATLPLAIRSNRFSRSLSTFNFVIMTLLGWIPRGTD